MEYADVLIIGGGFGGLTAAGLLSRAGKSVTLLEASNEWGGSAGKFRRGDYIYPVGATLGLGFQEPHGLHYRVFNHLGIPQPEKTLLTTVMDVHSAGFSIRVHADMDIHIQHLCRVFPEISGRIQDFYRLVAKTGDIFLSLLKKAPVMPPKTWRDWKTLLASADGRAAALVPYYRKTVTQVLAQFQLDKHYGFMQYINGQLLDSMQASADEAAALLGLYGLAIYHQGSHYMKGGLYRSAESLASAVKTNGGQAVKRRTIEKIYRNNGRWEAVDKRGRLFAAQDLVLNVPVQALPSLMSDADFAAMGGKWQKRSRTSIWSAFSMYGTLTEAPADTPLFQQIMWGSENAFEKEHMFVSLSEEEDTLRAPGRERTFTVSTHTSPERWKHRASYDEQKQQTLEELKQILLAQTGWSDALTSLLPGAPHAWEHYIHRPDGMVGGFPQTSRYALFNSLSHRTNLPGLWMCGDSVFPGGSTMAVTMSGIHVYESITGSRFYKEEQN